MVAESDFLISALRLLLQDFLKFCILPFGNGLNVSLGSLAGINRVFAGNAVGQQFCR